MFSDNFEVFAALLRRDLKVISRHTKDTLINDAIFVTLQIVVYGKLFPFFGFKQADLIGIIIGSILFIFPIIAFNKCNSLLECIHFTGFIKSELGLPLTTRWLAAKHVVSFFMQVLFSSFPMFIFAKILLWEDLSLMHARIFLFLAIYLLSCLFFALFFLFLVFRMSFDSFMADLWPRVLVPLTFLAPLFYSWQNAADVLPILSKFILLNPLTYFIEGIRASLLGDALFIPASYCMWVLLLVSVLLIPFFVKAFIKRLDLVGS